MVHMVLLYVCPKDDVNAYKLIFCQDSGGHYVEQTKN